MVVILFKEIIAFYRLAKLICDKSISFYYSFLYIVTGGCYV